MCVSMDQLRTDYLSGSGRHSLVSKDNPIVSLEEFHLHYEAFLLFLRLNRNLEIHTLRLIKQFPGLVRNETAKLRSIVKLDLVFGDLFFVFWRWLGDWDCVLVEDCPFDPSSRINILFMHIFNFLRPFKAEISLLILKAFGADWSVVANLWENCRLTFIMKILKGLPIVRFELVTAVLCAQMLLTCKSGQRAVVDGHQLSATVYRT